MPTYRMILQKKEENKTHHSEMVSYTTYINFKLQNYKNLKQKKKIILREQVGIYHEQPS